MSPKQDWLHRALFQAGGGPDAQGGSVDPPTDSAIYDRPDEPARPPDLVERLHSLALHGTDDERRTACEAADEIERLRSSLTADAIAYRQAEIERLRAEIRKRDDARWEREDAFDKQLGGDSLAEVVEERDKLRKELATIRRMLP